MEVVEHKNKSIFKTYMIYFIVILLFVVLRILVAENILLTDLFHLVIQIEMEKLQENFRQQIYRNLKKTAVLLFRENYQK